jgi:hypothetical protein
MIGPSFFWLLDGGETAPERAGSHRPEPDSTVDVRAPEPVKADSDRLTRRAAGSKPQSD